MKNIFFSKNKNTATKRLRNLCKQDKYYCKFKKVKLAKKQIKHIANWKTWILR